MYHFNKFNIKNRWFNIFYSFYFFNQGTRAVRYGKGVEYKKKSDYSLYIGAVSNNNIKLIRYRLYSTLNKNIKWLSKDLTNSINFSSWPAPSTAESRIEWDDADKDKLSILEYTKGKSGIYMWTNKLNQKKYVGSSVNLRRRLLEYYSIKRLLKENSMPINVALLKYGYHNFSFAILELCDLANLMTREKYFLIYIHLIIIY